MTDKKKRSLVKGLAGGGGVIATGAVLPKAWKQPVIDSVLLPAHAQTSVAVPDGTWEGSVFFGEVTGNRSSESIGQLVLNALIPPAHACLAGDVPLGIRVLAQQAILLTGSAPLAAVLIQGQVAHFLLAEISGQLSNVRAEYLPGSDEWDVFVEGLNNANPCAGNDAFGTLTRVSGP